MKRVCVTGGLGFLGSHLVNLLLSKNIEVVVIDNCSNNCIDPEDLDCEVITSGIADGIYWDLGIDAVFHLASSVGPVGVLKHSGELGYSIVKDTIVLRDYCIKKKIKLVYISTSEIYGAVTDWHEDSVKIFPSHYTVRSEYAAGKMTSEIAIVNKARVSDLNYVIIRPFNIAGPRQKPDFGFVLPRFVIAALTGQPITVYGDGEQRRAFTDVRDICSAIWLLANEARDVYNVGNIYNIGNPANEMSIRELAEKVLTMVNNSWSNIMYIHPKTLHGDLFEEVPDKMPCIDKLKELGWSPEYSIEQTIVDTITYYKWKLKNGYYFKVI